MKSTLYKVVKWQTAAYIQEERERDFEQDDDAKRVPPVLDFENVHVHEACSSSIAASEKKSLSNNFE